MPAIKGRIFAIILGCLAVMQTACTARTELRDGFPVYADIRHNHPLTYGISSDQNAGSPANSKRLLGLALSYWNQALGRPALSMVPDYRLADVKVLFKSVDTVTSHPAEVQLLGCMDGLAGVADCKINLEVPRHIDSPEAMASVAHLFRQGPGDALLYGDHEYLDVSDYLRDKLIMVSLLHEIGHSLGLAHTADRGCMMAAAPAGRLGFCPAELRAARRQLAALP